jgi:Fic family protein
MPGPGGLGPFFPAPRACGPLLERAAALAAEGHRLEAMSGQLATALRPLVRTMNACHSSELDGRPLRPAELEVGSTDDTSDARRSARAHVSAETGLLAALPTKSVGLYAPEFVQCIHAELHRARARSEDLAADEASNPGDVPGAWRVDPAPGRAAAPAADIPDLLDTWQGIYSKPYNLEQAVLAASCAQHRLLWVRPFTHGNGRSARLHTLLVLTALGLTQGVWSPLRGMARKRDDYYGLLRREPTGPDDPIARDGATQSTLEGFATWLLDVCLDEARTARELLDGERLKSRLADLLAWLGARPWVMGSEKSVIKPDALEALHYVAITGPVERARFIAMLGLQHRTGRRVLSSLLDFGLLVSESSRAPVRFNLPLASLRFLFPGVWPEAAGTDEPRSAAAVPSERAPALPASGQSHPVQNDPTAARDSTALPDSTAARADSDAARADSDAARADSDAARADSDAAPAEPRPDTGDSSTTGGPANEPGESEPPARYSYPAAGDSEPAPSEPYPAANLPPSTEDGLRY